MTPTYIPLKAAAEVRGGSIAGLRHSLNRLATRRPDFRVRRIHGRVHADDLSAALESLAAERERMPGPVNALLSTQEVRT